jgi:hypothetical protein
MTPITARLQTHFPYFLHSPPRPPQTPAASFKSRYRKCREDFGATQLGGSALPMNASDFWGIENRLLNIAALGRIYLPIAGEKGCYRQEWGNPRSSALKATFPRYRLPGILTAYSQAFGAILAA